MFFVTIKSNTLYKKLIISKNTKWTGITSNAVSHDMYREPINEFKNAANESIYIYIVRLHIE